MTVCNLLWRLGHGLRSKAQPHLLARRHLPRSLPSAFALSALVLLSGCLGGDDDGPREVIFMGSPQQTFETGPMLSPAAQQIRAATKAGLVTLNPEGEVLPGLAERWVITDDGLGYIFRLRNIAPEGSEPISGEAARAALIKAIKQQQGTPLGVDLEVISEIRAMTGRVIDIRLKTPMPQFLLLLAQPELALDVSGGRYSAMKLTREDTVAVLTPVPPEQRGLPEDPDWQDKVRDVRVRTLPARGAGDLFDGGQASAILGGTIVDFPLADLGPLSRGSLRLDGVRGMLGIRVVRPLGFLEKASNREALAMAIDREAMQQPFNIDGWQMTTRLVPPGLAGDTGTIPERWQGIAIEQRQEVARSRVSGWSADNGEESVTLTIYLPEGPGADILYNRLKRDWGRAGITLERSERASGHDLELFDRVARYDNARWYLNQFNCSLNLPLCSERADRAMAKALTEENTAVRREQIAIAEAELTKLNAYIPIGAPVRWSRVLGSVPGYAENRWAMHPLFPLAIDPT